MGAVQINYSTISSCTAEILTATAKVDPATRIIWGANYAWDTTSHTSGEIIPIKEEQEEGKRKYGIIWYVDEAWVLMSLTGKDTLTIQDKEDKSERLYKGEEGG